MIPLRAATHLWDVQQAAQRVLKFTSGCTFDDYLRNEMMSAAVERQLSIIGEALARLRRNAPDIAAEIPDLHRIIGFRNVLVHNYDTVDFAEVWDAITSHLPALLNTVSRLLEAAPKP